MNSPSPFGDISVETFLKEYWQKKPLLVRNAFPDFEPPVSADELAGLALEDEVESRLIVQSADGKDWQLEHGPLDEERFDTLPDTHWTLLVQAVDHWVPEASELVEQFRFAPNWRLDDLMISFATEGGGVGPHYDNYDVFLIQAEGTRCWEVGGIYGEDSPKREDLPVMILPEWEAEQSWNLEPGDMLYLPPRVGHNGYAVNGSCMTYSIGFRAPSHQEILSGFAQYLDNITCAEDRYSDPELQQQSNPGQISDEALQRVRSILQQYSDNPALLSDWFGTFMTEPKYADAESHSEELESCDELKQRIQHGAFICRNEGSRFAFYKTEEGFTLFVDGQSFNCKPQQQELAEHLCEERQPDLIKTTDDNLQLLLQLIHQGSLYLSD